MKIKRPLFPAALSGALALMASVGAAEAAALQLNGVNQSVRIADSPSVSPTGPITVEAWINRAASGVQHSIVEKFGCNTGDGGYVLRVTANDRLMFGTRDDCNNGSSVIGNVSIPANVWTHVAGSWDGTTLRVFVNGATDTTTGTTRNPKNGTSPLKIGERGNGGTPFNGRIDEVRLWNVARSAAQISANRTVCLNGTEAGLAGYWRLDEGAGVTTADATVNGNTGTLLNGAGWAPLNAFVCVAPPPPPPPPAPILFEAVTVSPPTAVGPLTVPTTLFPNPQIDTGELFTNGLPGVLPPGIIAEPFTPGGIILAINGTAPNQEFVVDIGNGVLRFFYSWAGTIITDPIAVGNAVRITGLRTLAPGPIIADEIVLRNAAVPGLDTGFRFQGVITRVTADVWTVGGVEFLIPGPASVHPAIVTVVNPVLGVTEAVISCLLNPAVFPPPPQGSPQFDALIIDPPAASLALPAPLFRNPISDTEDLKPAFLPPGTIADVAAPAAIVLGIRVDGTTGGIEYRLSANAGTRIFRAYTHAGTTFRGIPVVGDVIRCFGRRTLAPGPIIADVIRVDNNRAELSLDFSYIIQGVVTRADPTVWTVNGVDFNIVPVEASSHATLITSPGIPNVSIVQILFLPALGVVLGPPTVTVAATDAAAAEAGSDPAVFTINRVGLDTIPLNITYTLTGTALNGTDYGLTPLSVAMPVGVSSVAVTITPIDDVIFDPNESVTLTLTPQASYIVGASNSATATITDNEVGPPTVTVAATDAAAAETGSDPAVFTISRTGPTTVPVTINYTLTGTAANGTDYTVVPLSVVIPIGSSTAAITITPIDDAVFDPNETVILTITANAAYILGAPISATAIITDNEVGPPTVTVVATDAAAAETLSDPAVFTILRSGPTTVPVTVNYTLTGTALNGTDYSLVALSVVIPIGASSATVTITPIDDAVFDPNETVNLTVSANAAYVVGTPNSASAIITDNEVGPPTVTVAATDAAAAEALSNPAVFTVSRTGPTTGPLTVNYTLTGTALNGSDYTLVPLSVAIPIGASSATVTITPIDDAVFDPNETVILTVSANAAYVVGAANRATATITDNDVAPPPVANALSFNGVNQSVQVTDNASVSITGAITIEAWIRRSATGVQHSIVEKYGCNNGEGGYVLRVTANDNIMFGTRDDCNNGTSVTGGISIPANTWTHVAGHWDGTAMRVFVNGVQDGAGVTSTRNPKDGPTPLKIGERGNGGTPFNGQIDEVRLWSTTRSAAQLLANKGVCIPAGTPNLRGYWKLDEAAGATAADSSGNGNTGNLVNAPAHVITVAPVTCP